MFGKAVAVETEFVNESLPVRLIGMNAESMTQYIKYVADYWLAEMQHPKLYNVDNPFPFMDSICLESKSNFFEHRPSQYQRCETTFQFTMDDEF